MSLDATNLLRPLQVEESKEELQRMDDMLNAPPHIRGKISDVREMRNHRNKLKANLDEYTPHAYVPKEKDAAVSEFEMLAGQIAEGMLSSEEMRRNPQGAVSRHMAWEKRNKRKIMRYKHLALRLHASGDLPANLKFEGDIASIERLRPLSRGAQQLSMEGAQISKKRDMHFGADPAGTVTFSDAELETLRAETPTLADQIALLPNEIRAEIKKVLGKTKIAKPARETKEPSEKQKAHWANMAKLMAEKRVARKAEATQEPAAAEG